MDQSRRLQMAGGFGHAIATHSQHVGDQLLGHGQFVRGQPVQAQQQPAAQLLFDRMVPAAHGGLRHLSQKRLGVTQQHTL